MISVMLTEPGMAYTVVDSRSSAAKISGGGWRYEPKQYLSGGSFEGSFGLWDYFTAAGEDITTPTNAADMHYDEAKDGDSSVFLTFNTNTELYMSKIASSTEEKVALDNQQITFEIWVKNSSANLFAFIVCYGTHTVVSGSDTAIPVTTSWTKVTVSKTITYDTSEPAINDIKLFVGIGSTVGTVEGLFIDAASVYTPNDLSDIKIASYFDVSPNMYLLNAQNYVGKYCIISGGNNNRYGSLIESITAASDNISKVWLVDPLPFEFADGDEFLFLTPNYARRTSVEGRASVGEHVTSCTIASEITSGYSTANITLNRTAARLISRYNLVDWGVEISDDFGTVWVGYVSECTTTGKSLELTCSGYRKKLDDIYYSMYYDSEPGNTAPAMIADIIELIPDYVQGGNSALDRGNVLHDVQYASGGIGPMDFVDTPQKAGECVTKILSLGAFDEEMSPVYLQMWGRVPELIIVNRKPSFTDVKFILEPEFSSISTGITYRAGLDGQISSVFSIYRGTDGEQLETARMYELQKMRRYGIIEKSLSGGAGSDAEADIYLNVTLDDVAPSISTGEISVSGYVRMAGTGMRVPGSQVRAGDVIFVPEILGEMTTAYEANRGYEVVVAGNVSSDLVTGITTITPYSAPEAVEFVMSILEVDTGG